MIETAIHTLLANDARVRKVIKGGVWAVLMPERVAYPALSYLVVDSPVVATLDRPAGLAHPRIQVSAWANSYAEAKRAADAVRRALDGYAGMVRTADTIVHIQGIRWEDEREGYEEKTRTFHCSKDFFVWYRID